MRDERPLWAIAVVIVSLFGCQSKDTTSPQVETPVVVEGKCVIDDATPDSLDSVECAADFNKLGSVPLIAELPGARSTKVVLDLADEKQLYFQNSQKYEVHYAFVSTHLSGGDLPVVPSLSSFNATEYFAPADDRRFVLGAVTHYEGPDIWALELSPYDTASPALIDALYEAVSTHTYFGSVLKFHATSSTQEALLKQLSADVQIVTTSELYAAIDYQPLTPGTAFGRLRFITAAELETTYVSYTDIVVLDQVPNDISVVTGVISQEFQTPLSHINVLCRNRGTPNMGLRDATTNKQLRALEGKWVQLTVGPSTYSVTESTQAEVDLYWVKHRPEAVTLPPWNLEVKGLWDIEDVTPEEAGVTLRDAIKASVRAFGGKAAQYSILAKTEGVPHQKAFAVPIYYYDQFMTENGLWDTLDEMLAKPDFTESPDARDAYLQEFRDAMMQGTVNAEFVTLLQEKIAAEYGNVGMRFRTSTNSEDLEAFPCAGCYESHTGDPTDMADLLDAIKETWSTIWLFRTFEERTYYSVDHRAVGMSLLVHPSFPDEEANGVAVTNNLYDASGLQPAFYVNVQKGGDSEVVHPPPGVTTDQFLYFYDQPGQPTTYIARSNLVTAGGSVLSAKQVHSLGVALSAIHKRFSPAYGPAAGNNGWYGMDVEFKFDDFADTGAEATLYVKQARPYPAPKTE